MKGEIIGEQMKVIESSNKSLEGLHGRIVDETRNTIVLDSKTIPKKGSIFEINGTVVNGDALVARPEERIK